MPVPVPDLGKRAQARNGKVCIKNLFLSLCLVLCGFGTAQESKVRIALSFDDFPMATSILFEKKERAQKYAETLARLEIQALFFCIGEQLDSAEGKECLALIAKEHVLANHTFSHPHLSAISIQAFENEILKTENLLIHEPNFRKWFRFPFLDYGDRCHLGGCLNKRAEAFSTLQKLGYEHGYVTINTFDWHVDAALKKAVKEDQKIDYGNLKKAYLALLDKWMDEYQDKWSSTLKEDFVHVLLLHQNDLNALFLEEIVALIKKKDWEIVKAECAFETPIACLSTFAHKKPRRYKCIPSLNVEAIDAALKEHKAFEKKSGY